VVIAILGNLLDSESKDLSTYCKENAKMKKKPHHANLQKSHNF